MTSSHPTSDKASPSTSQPPDSTEEYRDFGQINLSDLRVQIPFPSSSRKGHRGGVFEPFPTRLHRALKEVEDAGMDHIISWAWHGRSFVMHNRYAFTDCIMTTYFNQSQLSSFHRQLNMYGFRRLTFECSGPQEFFHELFLKSRPDITHYIYRVKNKTRTLTKTKSCSYPNFESYPSCSRDGCAGAGRSSVISEQSDAEDDLDSVGTIEYETAPFCSMEPDFDLSALDWEVVSCEGQRIENWNFGMDALTTRGSIAKTHTLVFPSGGDTSLFLERQGGVHPSSSDKRIEDWRMLGNLNFDNHIHTSEEEKKKMLAPALSCSTLQSFEPLSGFSPLEPASMYLLHRP